MKKSTAAACVFAAITGVFAASIGIANAKPSERAQKVFNYWTAERVAKAQPRDLVIDGRGLAYLKGVDGVLTPYGHSIKPGLTMVPMSGEPQPRKGPPGGGGGGSGGGCTDAAAPSIGATTPADGASIGNTQLFTAVVTDDCGVRSVDFNIDYLGQIYTFAGTATGSNTWEVTVQGFTTGESGTWNVLAKDTAKRGGNATTSSDFSFTVGGGGGSGGTVANSHWIFGGAVQTAAGRILFEMPGNGPNWDYYVCSGTAATDSTSGRSVIITAAHCVYDDAHKKFARNVLFIPNQDGTSGAGTDLNCSNDPLGCWAPEFGVVEENWTSHVFPDNIPWDYAFYVVSDTTGHSGAGSNGALDSIAGSLAVDFLAPYVNDGDPGSDSLDFTHALGYSYSDDPNFMYCAEDMTTEGDYNWWLPSCDLSGGSSGGPWSQPMNESTGVGPIISVNSWGYTTGTGMAGPKLSGTTAQCVFDAAKVQSLSLGGNADGEQGYVVDPATCP